MFFLWCVPVKLKSPNMFNAVYCNSIRVPFFPRFAWSPTLIWSHWEWVCMSVKEGGFKITTSRFIQSRIKAKRNKQMYNLESYLLKVGLPRRQVTNVSEHTHMHYTRLLLWKRCRGSVLWQDESRQLKSLTSRVPTSLRLALWERRGKGSSGAKNFSYSDSDMARFTLCLWNRRRRGKGKTEPVKSVAASTIVSDMY